MEALTSVGKRDYFGNNLGDGSSWLTYRCFSLVADNWHPVLPFFLFIDAIQLTVDMKKSYKHKHFYLHLLIFL